MHTWMMCAHVLSERCLSPQTSAAVPFPGSYPIRCAPLRFPIGLLRVRSLPVSLLPDPGRDSSGWLTRVDETVAWHFLPHTQLSREFAAGPVPQPASSSDATRGQLSQNVTGPVEADCFPQLTALGRPDPRPGVLTVSGARGHPPGLLAGREYIGRDAAQTNRRHIVSVRETVDLA